MGVWGGGASSWDTALPTGPAWGGGSELVVFSGTPRAVSVQVWRGLRTHGRGRGQPTLP